MYGVYCSCEPAPNDVAHVHWRYVALAYAALTALTSTPLIKTFLLMPGRLIDWRVKVLLQQQKEKLHMAKVLAVHTTGREAEREDSFAASTAGKMASALLQKCNTPANQAAISLSLWQRLFANHDAVGICAAWGCTANAFRTVHGGKRYPYHRWKPPRWPARISATQHVLHAHQQHSMTCMHFSNTACPARTSATQHDLHAHQQHSRVGSGPDFYSPNCIATILPKLVRRRKDRTVHHSISKGVRLRQRQKAACSASKTQPALLQAAATSLLHTRALLKAPRCIYV